MKTQDMLLLGGAGLLAYLYFSRPATSATAASNDPLVRLANQISPGLGDQLASDLSSLISMPGSTARPIAVTQPYGQPSALQASSNPLATGINFFGGETLGQPVGSPSSANNSVAAASSFATPQPSAPMTPAAFNSFNGGGPIYVGATVTPAPAQQPPMLTTAQYVSALEGLTSIPGGGSLQAYQSAHPNDILAFDELASRNTPDESAAQYMTIAGGRDRLLATYTAAQLAQVAQRYYGGTSDLFGTIREGDAAYLATHS